MDSKEKESKTSTESVRVRKMLSKCSVLLGLPCSIIREHAWKAYYSLKLGRLPAGDEAFKVSKPYRVLLPQSPAKAMQTIWRMPILSGDA